MAAILTKKQTRVAAFFFTPNRKLKDNFSFSVVIRNQTTDYNFVNTLIFFWSVGPVHTIFYP